MKPFVLKTVPALILVAGSLAGSARVAECKPEAAKSVIGRYEISTIPVDPSLIVRSATFTPSGKVLLSYATSTNQGRRQLKLATMDEDGQNIRSFYSGTIPDRPKDNGIRFMVFPDNRRIFLGDFIIECTTSLETCKDPALLPVHYPAEVANGNYISHRWSEIIVAPDNRHIAWDALLTNGGVAVFTGELQRTGKAYKIVNTRIISTLNPFKADPRHRDGVLPKPFLGGEVKQFVHGGTAISMVGAVRRDVPDSIVQSLITGRKEAITDTPGYTETTIFSPDERLGMTMTSRFSEHTNPAILGLMPRPYPVSLNMGLGMLAYTYAVAGVRRVRAGNIGPALIDIQASKTQEGYKGIDLNTQADWVYYSPMSWSPDGKKAMWLERRRGGGAARIQVVSLPDYRPGPIIAARATPDRIPGASKDLSAVKRYARNGQAVNVKVYGRRSGYITYRRTRNGVIEKDYIDFSDDGRSFYSGSERMKANPRGRSTYVAKLRLTGPKPGMMDLKMTFGPLHSPRPAELLFSSDDKGVPLTHGFAEYDGRRIDVDTLEP